MKRYKIFNDDNITILKSLVDRGVLVDAVVTDPPYGLSFQGKKWDYELPPKELWGLVLQIMKPGAHLLSFGGTRTYHRMVASIEDAGFEIRDQIMWLYGSGFPKSHDISKAIDQELGVAREQITIPVRQVNNPKSVKSGHGVEGGDRPYMKLARERGYHITDSDKPATSEAEVWNGWGTGLKPAVEPIVLARKPVSEGNIAANVLKYGTGGINIDATRIPVDPIFDAHQLRMVNRNQKDDPNWGYNKDGEDTVPMIKEEGRWPANILFDEEAASMLDYQGQGMLESENASRFFYCAKASKYDRDGSLHPTVKPISLMRYLCKLITPKGGVVLDPFAGTGSTCLAALLEGYKAVGIEREKEYFEDMTRRLNKHVDLTELFEDITA